MDRLERRPMTEHRKSGESEAGSEIIQSHIRVDAEGVWTYEGREIFRKDILDLFYERLRLNADGVYGLKWEGRFHALEVQDTPFVITRVDRRIDPETQREVIELTLRHLDRKEILDPRTLWVGRENVLYCRIRDGAFPARFSRPAYYQIAQWIQEDPENGRFFIECDGKRFPIRACDPALS